MRFERPKTTLLKEKIYPVTLQLEARRVIIGWDLEANNKTDWKPPSIRREIQKGYIFLCDVKVISLGYPLQCFGKDLNHFSIWKDVGFHAFKAILTISWATIIHSSNLLCLYMFILLELGILFVWPLSKVNIYVLNVRFQFLQRCSHSHVLLATYFHCTFYHNENNYLHKDFFY